jgi:hypothetical protein
MIVSELIKKLIERLSIHGDLPVAVCDDTYPDMLHEVKSVELCGYKDKSLNIKPLVIDTYSGKPETKTQTSFQCSYFSRKEGRWVKIQ